MVIPKFNINLIVTEANEVSYCS